MNIKQFSVLYITNQPCHSDAISVIAFVVFLLLWVVNRGGKEKSILYDDQYDDIRENVMDHDEEGAGEEDQDCYDISRLQTSSTMDRYQPMSTKLLGRSRAL